MKKDVDYLICSVYVVMIQTKQLKYLLIAVAVISPGTKHLRPLAWPCNISDEEDGASFMLGVDKCMNDSKIAKHSNDNIEKIRNRRKQKIMNNSFSMLHELERLENLSEEYAEDLGLLNKRIRRDFQTYKTEAKLAVILANLNERIILQFA